MNDLISIVVSLFVFPGILFAFIATVIVAWLRGTARAASNGWAGAAPVYSFRQVMRLFQQDSVVPDGVQPVVIQALPIVALTAALLSIALLPLPANRGLGTATYGVDIATIGILLLIVPIVRIAIGLAIPSPFTRMAAIRSTRRLTGYLVPLALSLGTIAVIYGSTSVVSIAQHLLNSPLHFNDRVASLTSIIAGLAYFACLPELARLSSLHEGAGNLELVGSELTEISGRELFVMRAAEMMQSVAAIGFGITLFVMPFFTNDIARGLVAFVSLCVAALLLGWWEGLAPFLRTSEDDSAPIAIWVSVPTFLGVLAILGIILSQRFGV